MDTKQIIVSKRITQINDPILDLIKNTYEDSFPIEERRDFPLFCELVRNQPAFNVDAFFRDGAYVGFITSWQLEGFVYLEHFAIEKAARNGGIGAIVMNQFLSSLNSVPAVLEVELPNEEMSKRRIGFYQRIGFVLDDHDYLQPPYHSDEDFLPLRLMTFGDIDLNTSFEAVKTSIYSKVYGVK